MGIIHLLLIAIPLAAIVGWHWGCRRSFARAQAGQNELPPAYFIGLTYLINEQPDEAVDAFIKMLEVTPDTVETHLILGSLFRRRGEADRAIRIHQNLLARPELNKTQRMAALEELAEDYLRAGVLDRAERLFLELLTLDSNRPTSLRHLLHIYQQEKEWNKAIEVATQIVTHSQYPMGKLIAHYYCELADISWEKQQWEIVQQHLKSALSADPTCVRAGLLQAKLALQQGNYKAAIRQYQQLKQQDPEFISEIIIPLAHCYEQLGRQSELFDYLQQTLISTPRIITILWLSDYLRQHQNDRAAIEFLAYQIRQYPSLRGVQQLIQLYLANAQGDARDKLLLLYQLMAELLEKKPIYRCSQCGFAAKTLYWQCPQCREWGSVKPIHGLEGD